MKNKHLAMMKNLIAATKYATQEITKVEKKKTKTSLRKSNRRIRVLYGKDGQ